MQLVIPSGTVVTDGPGGQQVSPLQFGGNVHEGGGPIPLRSGGVGQQKATPQLGGYKQVNPLPHSFENASGLQRSPVPG
jgi:hypothetical protein